ncbi:MAG: tRNA uridine-5-carboxymethylaminomethyl(34) synthesis GTPase MnmE [Candidatus Kryptoniota bacterium]
MHAKANLKKNFDTIAAIATPIGEGGISVIRISGESAIPVADLLFKGRVKLSEVQSHTAHFGRLVTQDGTILDEVVATCFRKPSSYTCEDVVEISCHGGYLVSQKVLNEILNCGVRLAEPGEFTKRAFLNGRLDLTQAEAVADLIHAKSETAYKSSLKQLSGELSSEINSIRSELLDLASLLELELDFSEEDVEFADRHKLQSGIETAIAKIGRLASTYSIGRIYREGVRVVIVGKPNVGKSSLMNRLLGEKRAIVSEVPGTTRDTITEEIILHGIRFRLTDTAGLRDTSDTIENEGVLRTRQEASKADILLLIRDITEIRNGNKSADDIYANIENLCQLNNIPILAVWNKVDLIPEIENRKTSEGIFISALKGTGINVLKKKLYDMVVNIDLSENSIIVTSARHNDALRRAGRSLSLALESLREGQPGEFIALDLRAGLDALGEITGEVTTDDILNNIFSRFCIGK